MQRIILESSPEFVIICVLAGAAYALLQYYKMKNPWSTMINNVLFALRFFLVAFLSFLLLGPIVKQITNLFEKPLLVVLHDNSASIQQAVDTTALKQTADQLTSITAALRERGYETSVQTLDGQEVRRVQYNASSSDLNGALKRISDRFEGRNISGVVVVTDGIYNAGLSPLHATYGFPVHTVGVGDTSERMDISIKNIAYNKISYQGNRFPIRVEIQLKNVPAQALTVTLSKRGKIIQKVSEKSARDQLLTIDFEPEADEQGIQKYDITVESLPEEYNKRNNRQSIFVEIVEGRKKILFVAAAPHPDIKAIRTVIEKNANYEFLLHIPGIAEQPSANLQPQKIDLAIFHQSPDLRGKTNTLFQNFAGSKSSVFVILGQQSDLAGIARAGMPLKFENSPRDFDDVTPVINGAFSNFQISAEASSMATRFPPVSVPYGKFQLSPAATPLLFQKVGSLRTDKPLLAIDVKADKKIAIMLGEGLWRWRLHEHDVTESTSGFDELFGKLIQFLSTTDDKRRFRSYPIRQEFSDAEPVVFESQVYNDIFEPTYDNRIQLEFTAENGTKTSYAYVTSPGNTRYQIGGLKEGVYRYTSSTEINGKEEQVKGEFAVVERQIELQNLTADFDLLRRLSKQTGGQFFTQQTLTEFDQYTQTLEAKTIIHSEESYDSIINLKWVFWLLVVLIALEWGLRKFHGSY